MVTRYVYDNEDILFELDGSNNIITEYVHGPGIDEPIAMIRGGQTYYYHADALGSIIAITNSTGQVVQRYEYNSFGEITYQQDPNFVQPYTYTGREYDEESGLYYYRARYYDPKIGRFISEDPIGLEGGINLYVYVKNSPINFTDPSGLETCHWFGFSGNLVVGGGVQIVKQAGLCKDKCGDWKWKNRNCLCSCLGLSAGGCVGYESGDDSVENEGWGIGIKFVCISGSGGSIIPSGGGAGVGLKYGFAYCWCVCDISDI